MLNDIIWEIANSQQLRGERAQSPSFPSPKSKPFVAQCSIVSKKGQNHGPWSKNSQNKAMDCFPGDSNLTCSVSSLLHNDQAPNDHHTKKLEDLATPKLNFSGQSQYDSFFDQKTFNSGSNKLNLSLPKSSPLISSSNWETTFSQMNRRVQQRDQQSTNVQKCVDSGSLQQNYHSRDQQKNQCLQQTHGNKTSSQTMDRAGTALSILQHIVKMLSEAKHKAASNKTNESANEPRFQQPCEFSAGTPPP